MSEVQLFEVIGGFWVDMIYKIIKPLSNKESKKQNISDDEIPFFIQAKFIEYTDELIDKRSETGKTTLNGLYKYMNEIGYNFAVKKTFDKFIMDLGKVFFPKHLKNKLEYDTSVKLISSALNSINNCVIKYLNSTSFWLNMHNCKSIPDLQKCGGEFTNAYIQMSFVIQQKYYYEIDPPVKPGGNLEVTAKLAKKITKLKKDNDTLIQEINELRESFNELELKYNTIMRENEELTNKLLHTQRRINEPQNTNTFKLYETPKQSQVKYNEQEYSRKKEDNPINIIKGEDNDEEKDDNDNKDEEKDDDEDDEDEDDEEEDDDEDDDEDKEESHIELAKRLIQRRQGNKHINKFLENK